MTTIWVTNESDKTVKGRYAGEDYEFPVGVATPVDEDAARHIFGFGESDKTAALRRLGWAIMSSDYEDAMSRLASIKFAASPPDGDAAPSGNAGPLVNAGGVEEEGEAKVSPSSKTTRLKKGGERII